MEKRKDEMDLLIKKNKELSGRIQELEDTVLNMSVPIIPSIIPNTILIPIAGELSDERFSIIIPKILDHAGSGDIDSVVIDFTAIASADIEDLELLGNNVESLTSSLKLMGIQVLLVGFTPQLAQNLVHSQLPFVKELNAFSSFKTALQYLMKQKGLVLTKSDPK